MDESRKRSNPILLWVISIVVLVVVAASMWYMASYLVPFLAALWDKRF